MFKIQKINYSTRYDHRDIDSMYTYAKNCFMLTHLFANCHMPHTICETITFRELLECY